MNKENKGMLLSGVAIAIIVVAIIFPLPGTAIPFLMGMVAGPLFVVGATLLGEAYEEEEK